VSDIAGSFLQLDTLFILALGLLAFIPDTTGCLLKTILLALQGNSSARKSNNGKKNRGGFHRPRFLIKSPVKLSSGSVLAFLVHEGLSKVNSIASS
jgi:hypothetical protein